MQGQWKSSCNNLFPLNDYEEGEMYFIFGSIIGGSPSNCTKGDTKDCSSRRDEPYTSFSRVLKSEPWRSLLCSVSHQ